MTAQVSLSTLDEIFGSTTKVGFIKIDVEGHESAVINGISTQRSYLIDARAGARKILSLHKPAVLLELSPTHSKAAGVNAGEAPAIEQLMRLGYGVKGLFQSAADG